MTDPSSDSTHEPPEALDSPDRTDPVAALVTDTGEPRPGKHDVDEVQAAFDWFVEDNPEPLYTRSLRLNVGGEGDREKHVTVRLRALEDSDMRKITRAVQANRAFRKMKGDELSAARQQDTQLRMVATALVTPDPKEILAASEKWTDIVEVIQAKFGHKPGLIMQMVGAIYELSGYGDDDVEDVSGNAS